MLRCRSVAVNDGVMLRSLSVSGWRRAPGREAERARALARGCLGFFLFAIGLAPKGSQSVAKERAPRQIPHSLNQGPGRGDQQRRSDVGRQAERRKRQFQRPERSLQRRFQLRHALRGEKGHQSGRADRGGARRLFQHGALVGARKSGTSRDAHRDACRRDARDGGRSAQDHEERAGRAGQGRRNRSSGLPASSRGREKELPRLQGAAEQRRDYDGGKTGLSAAWRPRSSLTNSSKPPPTRKNTRIVATPARWLRKACVASPSSAGPANAVSRPENAKKPKNSFSLPRGANRAMRERLAD